MLITSNHIGIGIITAMIECGEHEMDAADEKLYRATEPMRLIEEFADGVFDVSVVRSGDNQYRVVRMATFAHCECRDFEHSRTPCKHIAFTSPIVCRRCFTEPVKHRGHKCQRCMREARNQLMDDAPLLKPSSPPKQVVTVAGIRI